MSYNKTQGEVNCRCLIKLSGQKGECKCISQVMYHVETRSPAALIRLPDKGSPPISLPMKPLNVSRHLLLAFVGPFILCPASNRLKSILRQKLHHFPTLRYHLRLETVDFIPQTNTVYFPLAAARLSIPLSTLKDFSDVYIR